MWHLSYVGKHVHKWTTLTSWQCWRGQFELKCSQSIYSLFANLSSSCITKCCYTEPYWSPFGLMIFNCEILPVTPTLLFLLFIELMKIISWLHCYLKQALQQCLGNLYSFITKMTFFHCRSRCGCKQVNDKVTNVNNTMSGRKIKL